MCYSHWQRHHILENSVILDLFLSSLSNVNVKIPISVKGVKESSFAIRFISKRGEFLISPEQIRKQRREFLNMRLPQ
ncbi:unnamed protein product [Hermetia illucens]|uniref:Uncharacterized protein n=1 Tax=Hermetia illucens TaxID=343691 RepID=A0A7R8UWU0_HERIL|nr:unnamed protein product [Hermetia illucens]